MSKKIKVIIIVVSVFIVISSYLVWKTETFQKYIFPQKYWSEQVKKIEFRLRFKQNMIMDSILDLAKIQRTEDLDIAKKVNEAKLLGINVEKAKIDAIEEIQKKIEFLKDYIRMMKKNLEKDKTELEQAEIELTKYQ